MFCPQPKDQQDKINRLRTEWFPGSANPLAARLERRRKSQLQFLAQLRSSQDKAELEKWYVSKRSFMNDMLLIILTAWVIIFKKSNLVWLIFKDLPKNITVNSQ